MIKDSGDRRTFDSGAVRDMSDGQKGRCDLMPLDVVCYLLDDAVIGAIADYLRNPKYTAPLYAALNDFAHDHYDGQKSTMLLEVAKHFQEGAEKYGENNWQKGIPAWCYIDSAVRHYLKYRRGDDDERHDRAFVWNIMCCIWEVDFHNADNQ